MKKQNGPTAQAQNVQTRTVLESYRRTKNNLCSSSDVFASYQELSRYPLNVLFTVAAIWLSEGKYNDARFILGVAAREESIQAMFALSRMLIYGLVPGVDFDLDIYPLVHKAANHYHIPSMWMMARWLHNGEFVPKNEEDAEMWLYMVSKLDPKGEHMHPLVDHDAVTEDDNSILVDDIIEALEYNPNEVFEPESEEDVRKKFFTE